MGKHLRVIAYDIASDRRRRRVEKMVSRYALRVQGSVFEGWLTEAQVAELRRRVAPLLQPLSDSLRIYSLCAACDQGVSVVGRPTRPEPPPHDIIA